MNKILRILILTALISAFQPGVPASAETVEPMVPFFTLKEAVAKLLPNAKKLTQRDIVLDGERLNRLRQLKNWDTGETRFTLYHARNEKGKITGALVIFPEPTVQGPLVLAVALSNEGRVTEALLMEAGNKTADRLLPLLRAGYMQTFAGKDKDMKLVLDKKFKGQEFSPIAQTYALHIANAVKKSAQLFDALFKKKRSSP
ncbi:MAG: hypothetical protein HY580_01110 [Nitrospinae bacterium]|nr:hypothetical protein [Nitrospinota bacterium]